MGITFGDHLIDSGYYDITPEQEREIEAASDLRQVAWLIERKTYEGSDRAVWYREEPNGWHWWVLDANQAMRFASKAEAEASPAYQMIASDPAISITEHVFMEGSS